MNGKREKSGGEEKEEREGPRARGRELELFSASTAKSRGPPERLPFAVVKLNLSSFVYLMDSIIWYLPEAREQAMGWGTTAREPLVRLAALIALPKRFQKMKNNKYIKY